MSSIQELQNISTQIRRDVIRMTCSAASGHPGGSLGCADFFAALYFSVIKLDAANFSIDGKGEALFFLSNGHISPVWYSTLARYGFFSIGELSQFRKINSRLQGHPTPHEGLPGIRMASGSLGQGLSVSIGAALSKKLNGDASLVYCLTGDGELQEGQNWEALMYASAKKVDNLIAVIDFNGKQIDGDTSTVLDFGNLKEKLIAFGWITLEMDGNEMADILKVMEEAKAMTGKGRPIVIMMRTHMGYGVDFMLDNHEWHGVPPTPAQADAALMQLLETLGDYPDGIGKKQN